MSHPSAPSIARRRMVRLIAALAVKERMAPLVLDPELIGAGWLTGLLPTLIERSAPGCSSDPAAPARIGDPTGSMLSRYQYRRQVQRQRLGLMIGAWNKAGVVPLLGPGAGAVWRATSPWRLIAHLEVLVAPDRVAAAESALAGAGYRRVSVLDRGWRPSWSRWFHAETSGTFLLGAHGRDARLERLLSAADILAAETIDTRDGHRVAVLAEAVDIALGFALALTAERAPGIGLKALQELAEAIEALEPKGAARLNALAQASPALKASLAAALALAARHLALAAPPALAAALPPAPERATANSGDPFADAIIGGVDGIRWRLE